jgi:hypothetical protein
LYNVELEFRSSLIERVTTLFFFFFTNINGSSQWDDYLSLSQHRTDVL